MIELASAVRQAGVRNYSRRHQLGHGLIGFWSSEERGGTSVFDLSGRSQSGTFSNLTAASWTRAPNGYAIDFAATADRVDVATTYPLLTQQTYVIRVMGRSGGGGNLGRLYHKKSSTSGIPSIMIDNRGGADGTWALRFEYSFQSVVGIWATSDNSLVQNKWHNIVITYDASSTSNDPIVWIDGKKYSTGAGLTERQTPSGSAPTDTNNGYIGNRSDAIRNWDGLIAYCAVFDRLCHDGFAVELQSDPFLLWQSDIVPIWAPSAGMPGSFSLLGTKRGQRQVFDT